MFNNVALDVAIGLTFIFVLYSLLAMCVNEFFATIFAYRHRMLERGLEQMLDGKNYGYYWWDKLANFFLWIYYSLLQYKSTSQNEEIKSLPVFLSKTDLGNPKIEKADGTSQFYYRRVKINAKSELFALNITSHPLYKRKAEKSLLFKKPAYLTADSFADMLVDVLGKNRKPGSPVLMKDIADFVNTAILNNDDLKKVLNVYIEQANGDVQRFRFLLENWFNDTMDRVNGWYRKQSYKISVIIGLILAMSFNVSTITIVKKLSKDKKAREALLQNASAYVKTKIIDPPTAKDTCWQITDSTGKKKDTCLPKAGAQADDPEAAKKKLKQIDSLYKTDIAENDSILGLGWGDFGFAALERTKKKMDQYRKDSAAYAQKEKAKTLTEEDKKPEKPRDHRTVAGRIFYIIGKTFSSTSLFFGFLITAFAISLGAPFWFDLLNKFVNLRVSGAKPEDRGNNPQATKTVLLNKKPDPTAKG